MGAGLIILVSGSKEKYYLTRNPEITFFKIIYKRHTNFSIETIPQYFINPIDFGKQATIVLGKNGDLIGKIFLHLELPVITENISSKPIYKIRYTENLGYALINKIELEIGGIIIARDYGEWMYIWKEIASSLDQQRGINQMIGNNKTFNSNEVSKDSLTLDIPLNFWFCQNLGNALPIVSLTHDEIKLHIELRNLNDVLIQSPQKYVKTSENFSLLQVGEKFVQNVNGIESAGEFVEFDIVEKRLYYNPLYGEFQIPSNSNDENYLLTGTNGYQHHLVSELAINSVTDYFNLNPPSMIQGYCLVNYVFLDNEERFLYLTKNHEYLIPVLQNIPEESVFSGNVKLNLPLVHPVSSIFWRVILENNIQRKDYFNYSTYPITETPQAIVRNIKIMLNGQPLSNVENEVFFSPIQKHHYFEGRGNRYLYHYSFSLHPMENQPYGSLNFSKLDDSYIQLSLDGLINYRIPARIKAYAINYNIFRVINGTGNLVFSS
jgi:hypothetical protein